MTFSTEIQFLKNVEHLDGQGGREVISRNQRHQMMEEHPNVPIAYLDYLGEIGWGECGKGQFMAYTGLLTLDDLGLSEHYQMKTNMYFFGDNYSGDLSGFNADNNYSVIEFWHVQGEIYETGQSFQEYIRAQMGMDENGNDVLQ